jgi:hypothetical protein
MKPLREKVIEACPELGNAEVKLLMEELRVNSRDENVYEAQIKVTARSLFSELYRWREFRKREAIATAVELLKDVDAILADIPDMSDEVARTQQDVQSNVVYLFKELDK